MKQEELNELLAEMSVDEKVGQLLQLSGDFYSDKAEERTGPISQLGVSEEEIANAGTVLGVGGAAECRRIQREYMEKHRLHIPTLFMGDIIHGYKTIFPIPLGLASSWDIDAARTMAEVSAAEAAVSGIFLTFSPMVDLVRDPRWGRVMESTGEDPYLNAQLARALVEGYQGEQLRDDFNRVAACVKHFAGYGAPVGGRDYNTVNMSERELREMYLPGYRAALDAGAKTVMTSFNTVDGIPATANRHLMRDILRKEWGFNGVLISDFGAVQELIAHGVAQDEAQAAELALKAGVDIEMMSICFLRNVKHLIDEGAVQESLLDEAVMRILTLKNDLGLFENPLRGVDEQREQEVVFCDEHKAKTLQVAQESLVLLKNENGVLPLDQQTSVALVGPGALSHDILGAWSWMGNPEHAVSLAEGMKAVSQELASAEDTNSSVADSDSSSSFNAPFASLRIAQEECDYIHPSSRAVEEAVRLARECSTVVLALAETSEMSGEAASRSDIRLPEAQIELLRSVQAVNPHVVVVLFNGRPLDLSDIDGAEAIVEAWFPGTEGGRAIAEVLYGNVNPSGHVTMSFPQSVGQVPVYYNGFNTGRPFEAHPQEKYVSKYLDTSNYAKYPFGFGLSYSVFEYGEVRVSGVEFDQHTALEINVEISNTSNVDGVAVPQLYIRDLVGEVVRPVKELKGFARVNIPAYESRTVSFTLNESDVRYVHSDLSWSSDTGEFEIMVGSDSQHLSESVRVQLR